MTHSNQSPDRPPTFLRRHAAAAISPVRNRYGPRREGWPDCQGRFAGGRDTFTCWGIDIVSVSNMLGHANPRTTLMTYGHVTDKASEAAESIANVVDAAMKRKPAALVVPLKRAVSESNRCLLGTAVTWPEIDGGHGAGNQHLQLYLRITLSYAASRGIRSMKCLPLRAHGSHRR